MVFQQNQAEVAYYSSIMFHVIRFIAFVVAIKLLPKFQELAIQYVPQEILQTPVAYLATFVAALYVIPEVGCMVYKMTMISE